MPNGFVSKTFSLGGVGSPAHAISIKHASTSPNVNARVFILGRVFPGMSVCLFGHNLRFLGGLRGMVNHGVGVFNANAISTSLRPEQPHKRVVVLPVFPIALPFE